MRASELCKWQDVVPTMMSDEEDVGDNTFRVHRQDWCSEEMTDFLDELNRRADDAMKRVHPRKNQAPLKTTAPENTKDWMLKADQD